MERGLITFKKPSRNMMLSPCVNSCGTALEVSIIRISLMLTNYQTTRPFLIGASVERLNRMQKATNPALAALSKLQAGFWLSDKELKETVSFLENQDSRIAALQDENDRLKAALAPFAKLGSLKLHTPDTPMLDYGNIQIVYGDFVKAANLLFEKDRNDANL